VPADLKVSYTLDKSDQRHDSLSSRRVGFQGLEPRRTTSWSMLGASKKEDSIAYATMQDPAATDCGMRRATTGTPPSPSSPTLRKNRERIRIAQVSGERPQLFDAAPEARGRLCAGKIPIRCRQRAATRSVRPGRPALENIEKKTVKIAESFTQRIAVLNKVLDVGMDSVRLSFLNNGEIDGDSISVFVNSHWY